jgi:hypothetical protein
MGRSRARLAGWAERAEERETASAGEKQRGPSWAATRGGLERKEEGGEIKEKPFQISKPIKQMNSNKDLNSNNQNNTPACMQQGIPIFH